MQAAPPSELSAVILAAGRGARLGAVTAHAPKTLLRVGPAPLIERQVRLLEAFQIGCIYVVVGFGGDQVRHILGDRVVYVDNPHWAFTNNLYSLYLCRQHMQGPFVLINGDDLFHPDVLARLLQTPWHDALCIDRARQPAAEAMKATIVNGRVRALSKQMPEAKTDGEYIGMLRLGAHGAARLDAVLERFVTEGRLDTWYEAGLQELGSQHPLHVVDVTELPWIEIDTPADLEQARNDIWPRICPAP